jgi:hypothetical protein
MYALLCLDVVERDSPDRPVRATGEVHDRSRAMRSYRPPPTCAAEAGPAVNGDAHHWLDMGQRRARLGRARISSISDADVTMP